MRTKKDFDHQNEYNKQKYDQYTLMLPKGQKQKLNQIAEKNNTSLRAIINKAIEEYINKLDNEDEK